LNKIYEIENSSAAIPSLFSTTRRISDSKSIVSYPLVAQ
jgi:hypothetical protein